MSAVLGAVVGFVDFKQVCPCWPVSSPLPHEAPQSAEVPLALTPKAVTCLPLPCRAHNFAELGDGAHWEQLMTHLMEAHQPATSPTDKAALDALPRRSVRPEDGDRDGLHPHQDQQVSFVSSASSAGGQERGWCGLHSNTSQASLVCPHVQRGKAWTVWATYR